MSCFIYLLNAYTNRTRITRKFRKSGSYEHIHPSNNIEIYAESTWRRLTFCWLKYTVFLEDELFRYSNEPCELGYTRKKESSVASQTRHLVLK